MSLRSELAPVIARDPRYTIEAYEFAFAALDNARRVKMKREGLGRRRRRRGRVAGVTHHVSGAELCHAARELALDLFGLMALPVLARWGLRSTSDIGNVVYNLIEAGDFEKTPEDSRADFDNVFDFEVALRREYVMDLREVG